MDIWKPFEFDEDIIDKFKLMRDRHFANGDVWKSELK